jgi:hypothetical protein
MPSEQTPRVGIVIPSAAARRVSNQISRAFRGTYGAKTGLRTIVRAIALDLLATGAAREAVAQALEECVLNHPARLEQDVRNVVTGGDRSAMIIEVVRATVVGVAIELEHAS